MPSTEAEVTRAEEFVALWEKERAFLTIEQGYKIGIAYITEILGLSKEVAERFSRNDSDAYHEVGMRQGGIGRTDRTPNFRAFWQEISSIAPNLCPENDVEFLFEHGDAFGVCWLISLIQETSGATLLSSLRTNAHVYK